MRTIRALTTAVIALLGGAVQASAALPEDGISACRELRSELVYIARAGTPFRYRLFHEEIDRAREAWVKAQAAYDKSPRNIDLQIAAIEAHAEFENWTIRSFEMTLVPIAIERVFRGSPAAESFIVLRADMKIDAGRSYVFYGENRFANLGLNFHEGWAQDVMSLPQGVRVLDASATNGGGMVYGALELEHVKESQRATPLPGTRIRLTAPGYSEESETDTDGIFLVSNVPPGVVTITALLPDQLAVTNRSSLTARVASGGCIPVDLRAALNGRIRGRIVDGSGKPRSHLPLVLYPSERGWSGSLDERYRVSTNENGGFEFRAIRPGSYLLGHQIISPHIVMPGQKLPPRTYYPGTPNRDAAIPIVVGNATQHDGVDFIVR